MRDKQITVRMSDELREKLDAKDAPPGGVGVLIRDALDLITDSRGIELTTGEIALTDEHNEERFSMRLSSELRDATDEFAHMMGVPSSAVVRWAILYTVDRESVRLTAPVSS